MLTGTIKFFNKSKGFGFITSDAGGKEVFLPSATVMASGLKKVEPGLRVSYSEEPDVKGPKAVALQALDEPRRVPEGRIAEEPRRMPDEPRRVPPRATGVTLYHDPASSRFEAVRDALAAQGTEVALVDYTATPPDPQELKKWSLALSGLVRRSDALFYALQLDDRFISENDFWLAVSQHPTLINGPILKSGNKLAVCKTTEDVRRFLGLEGGDVDGDARPKGLSRRLSALIRGEALPPEEDEPDEDEAEEDFEDAVPDTVVLAQPQGAKPQEEKSAEAERADQSALQAEPVARPAKAEAKPAKAAKPKPEAKAAAKKAPAAKQPASPSKSPATKAKTKKP